MKLINPKYEIIEQEPGLSGIYKSIELAGRTCYKSEDKITDTSAKEFVDRMVKSGHHSMLEFGTVYLSYESCRGEDDSEPIFDNVLDHYENNKYSKYTLTNPEYYMIKSYVTTNYRVLVENGWLDDLKYLCEPTEYHEKRVYVRFTTDRGVSHELVRHRVFSFAQESTRYCVDGDTLLKYKNPHWNYSIKELYDKTKKSNGSWKRIKIENLDEKTGELKFSKIKNIFYNGVKQVYELKTKLGYSLKCTLNHKIYTPKGYKELGELKIGNNIYVNGNNVKSEFLYRDYDWLYNQNITLDKTFVRISHEFNYNVNTIKKWAKKLQIPCKGTGYFNIGRVPWNKGMSENSDSRVRRQANALREYHYDSSKKGIKILKEDTSKYQKYLKDACEICGSKKDLEVHHINKNHLDNSITNLMTVCSSCHKRIHNQNLNILHSDEIVSIELIGERDVYDLEMEDHSNYVANGIIVHNCNYSKDKFSNELTFIIPSWCTLEEGRYKWNGFNYGDEDYWCGWRKDSEPLNIEQSSDLGKTIIKRMINYHALLRSLNSSEENYKELLSKHTPQEARQVLPNALKTEINMCGFVSDWKRFFTLRDNPHVHPDMQALVKPLHKEFVDNGTIDKRQPNV